MISDPNAALRPPPPPTRGWKGRSHRPRTQLLRKGDKGLRRMSGVSDVVEAAAAPLNVGMWTDVLTQHLEGHSLVRDGPLPSGNRVASRWGLGASGDLGVTRRTLTEVPGATQGPAVRLVVRGGSCAPR